MENIKFWRRPSRISILFYYNRGHYKVATELLSLLNYPVRIYDPGHTPAFPKAQRPPPLREGVL
jgi:hypothetical protein